MSLLWLPWHSKSPGKDPARKSTFHHLDKLLSICKLTIRDLYITYARLYGKVSTHCNLTIIVWPTWDKRRTRELIGVKWKKWLVFWNASPIEQLCRELGMKSNDYFRSRWKKEKLETLKQARFLPYKLNLIYIFILFWKPRFLYYLLFFRFSIFKLI